MHILSKVSKCTSNDMIGASKNPLQSFLDNVTNCDLGRMLAYKMWARGFSWEIWDFKQN